MKSICGLIRKGMDYDLYDDEQLVNGILNNNRPLIEYFFQKKCSKLFTYILLNVFDGNIDKRELVGELYLFMANNNWQVFRNFQFRSSLMTYVSVIAVRFFQKRRAQLIDSPYSTDLNEKTWKGQTTSSPIDRRMDIQLALQKIPNARYRMVIEELDLQDVRPEQLADNMNVTVDNLYNIHRRALMQLRVVMGRKEEYV